MYKTDLVNMLPLVLGEVTVTADVIQTEPLRNNIESLQRVGSLGTNQTVTEQRITESCYCQGCYWKKNLKGLLLKIIIDWTVTEQEII